MFTVKQRQKQTQERVFCLDTDYEGILMILHYMYILLLHIDMTSLISDNTAKASSLMHEAAKEIKKKAGTRYVSWRCDLLCED